MSISSAVKLDKIWKTFESRNSSPDFLILPEIVSYFLVSMPHFVHPAAFSSFFLKSDFSFYIELDLFSS